jgi:hypothetical protein
VVLLDIDAASVWERREVYRLTEMGLHDGYENLGRESFVHYQGRVAGALSAPARPPRWTTVAVDPRAPEEVNAARVESEVRARLRPMTQARPDASPDASGTSRWPAVGEGLSNILCCTMIRCLGSDRAGLDRRWRIAGGG